MSQVIDFTKESNLLNNIKKMTDIMIAEGQDVTINPLVREDLLLSMIVAKNDIDIHNSIKAYISMVPEEHRRFYGTMLIAVLAKHIGRTIATFSESLSDITKMTEISEDFTRKQLTKGETYE